MILLLEVFRKKIIQSCLLVTAVLVSSTVLAAAKKRVDSVDTFVFGRTHVAARQPLFLQTVKSGAFKHKKNKFDVWDIHWNKKIYKTHEIAKEAIEQMKSVYDFYSTILKEK